MINSDIRGNGMGAVGVCSNQNSFILTNKINKVRKVGMISFIKEAGDTLPKVSKEYYGNANAFMKILEVNKLMLSHPDKIYTGQMLRITPQ